jgi:hypothetical protein
MKPVVGLLTSSPNKKSLAGSYGTGLVQRTFQRRTVLCGQDRPSIGNDLSANVY